MSDMKERLQKKKRENEWAEAWRPEASGEMLTGTLEKMDEVEVQHGTYPVAQIRDEETDELRAMWLFHKVLRTQWEEQTPTPGDRVGILYLGLREGAQNSYHMYDLEVEGVTESEEPAREENTDSRPPRRLQPDEGHDQRPTPSMDNPNAELPY